MDMLTLGVITLVYIGVIAFLGWRGYRSTRNANDYLLAGGEIPPIVMALSYGAAFISASAIVGFGGVAATYGMGIMWLNLLNMLVGVVIAFIVFGRRTRLLGSQLQAKTFPELFGKYFNSNAIRYFIAAIIILGMPLYASVVMKGGAVFVEQVFDIDYHLALFCFTLIIAVYVITGGLKGVMYVDALQAGIMVVSISLLMYFTYAKLGMGFTEANVALSDAASLVPEQFKALGHRGWTAMPEFGSPWWFNLVTSLIMGVGIGVLAQPQLVVRFMTVKSTRDLNRAVFAGCLFLTLTVGFIFHIGPISNLLFLKETGKVASEAVADMDKIIPTFINMATPNWFTALFMLCILSAAMSTLSSQLHTMGTAIGHDVVGTIKNRTKKNDNTVLITRLGIVFAILVSYIISYMLPVSIIARGTAIFFGICAATFLPTYFAILYIKGVTRQAALWSLWTGALTSTFALLFLHQKESAAIGLCDWLFGKPVLIETFPFPVIDPIVWALPLSILTLVVVQIISKRKAN